MASTRIPDTATLTYPSAAAPGFTHFTLKYPAIWLVQESPTFLTVLVDPLASKRFHANFLVAATRVPLTTQLTQAATEALARTHQLYPDLTVTREDSVLVSDQPALLRLQSFSVPEITGRVAQTEIVFFAPRRPDQQLAEAFQFHATCHAAAVNEYTKPFLDIVRSFRFLNVNP